MTESKNIPELRFPGFRGAWEEKKLGEITEVVSSNIRVSDLKERGETPVYDVLEMIGYTDKKGLDTDYISIIKDGSGVGRVKILPRNSLFIATMNGIKVKNSNLYFVYLIFKNLNFLKYIVGSGIPHIYYRDYSKEKINLPSLPEQEKIGSFFYTLDQKLDLQKKRIEELKTYKKGMMQRIFDQEIRFKDENGQDYPEWEEKKLGEITEVVSSNIRVSDLKERGETPVYDVLEMIGYTDKKGLDTDYISIIKDGSGVGRVKILPRNSLFIATMNGIKVKNSNLYFVYLIFKNLNFLKYIVGSGIPHIYYRDYSKEKINLPSLPEQEKIASFLSNLDRRIELEEERLESYEEFKKGLMQRMFV